MPTFRHGKVVKVFYGAYDLSTMLREASFNRTADTPETTAFGSVNKSYVVGIPGGVANCSGMFSAGASDIAPVLDAAFGQETPSPITIAYDSGVANGKRVYGGLSLLSTFNITGSISDMVGITADFQLTDVAAPGISLRDPGSALALTGVASAGTATDYDALDNASNQMPFGGLAILHVVANTVNAGTTMALQSATTSGGAYSDFATFASIPATTIQTQYVIVPRTTTVNQWLRYNITATGTGNLSFLTYFVPSQY